MSEAASAACRGGAAQHGAGGVARRRGGRGGVALAWARVSRRQRGAGGGEGREVAGGCAVRALPMRLLFITNGVCSIVEPRFVRKWIAYEMSA
eukprot:5761547-Prymnesium_polylepis.1